MTSPSFTPACPTPHSSMRAAASASAPAVVRSSRPDGLRVDDDLGAGLGLDGIDDLLGVGDGVRREDAGVVVDRLIVDGLGERRARRDRRGGGSWCGGWIRAGGEDAADGQSTARRSAQEDGPGATRDHARAPAVIGWRTRRPADQLGGLLVPAEARHDVGPGDECVDLFEERERSARARPRRRARRPRAAPSRAASGIVMPGHLVVQELRVARALERQDAEQHRQREPAPDRTGAATRGPSPRPARRSYSGWVMTRWAPASILRSRRSHSVAASAAVGSSAQAMVNPAGAPIGLPAPSSPRFEPGQDLDEPDGIDVPDAGPGRVVADPRRIAGQRQDVRGPRARARPGAPTRAPSGCGRGS